MHMEILKDKPLIIKKIIGLCASLSADFTVFGNLTYLVLLCKTWNSAYKGL